MPFTLFALSRSGECMGSSNNYHNSSRSASTPQALLCIFAMFCAASAYAELGPPGNTNSQGNMPVRYIVIDLGTNFFPAAINNSNVVAGNIGTSLLPQISLEPSPVFLPSNEGAAV